MGHGEVSSLLVCKPLYIGNRAETSRSQSAKKPQSSNSKTTKNSNKNFPLPLYGMLHTRCQKFVHCVFRLGGQKDTIKLPKHHLYQITNQPCTRIQGWPSSIKQVPQVLQPYWTFREELTVEDGLIL